MRLIPTDLDAFVESPIVSTMQGFEQILKIELGSIDHITMLIVGNLDYDLRCALYHSMKKQHAVHVRDLMLPEVTAPLERMKTRYKSMLQLAMQDEARAEQAEQARLRTEEGRRQFDKVAGQFKSMNQPAPEGTIDELCKKYGVSKSHVRMLKREGRLHELTASDSSAG